MKRNKLLGVLAVAALLFSSSCSKDKGADSFVPGIYELSDELQQWVRKYPGEVVAEVPRLEGVPVSVSGDYTPPTAGQTAVVPLCWQSSGLYAPPAEQITVDVPAGVTNLKYRVGVAAVELKSSEQKDRYHNVSEVGSLTTGANTFKTTFGGPLYFYFEGTPSSGVTVTVSGAVKSHDFVSGETSATAWHAQTGCAPWGELIGRRVIFTLPAAMLQKIADPQAFLDFYDEFFEKDVEALIDFNAADMPWRIYADAQLPAGQEQTAPVLDAAYPMAFVPSRMEDVVLGLPRFEGDGLDEWVDGLSELYGMGEAASTDADGIRRPMYSPEMESIMTSLSWWHLMQRKGHWSDVSAGMKQSKPQTERYWMARQDDRRSMMIQLLQQYGWGWRKYAYKRFAEEMPANLCDRYRDDLLAIYAGEYTNTDLTDFFKAWNVPVAMYAQQYMKHYPAPRQSFWTSTDPSKQPEETTESPAGVTYEKIIPTNDIVYLRTPWTVSASSEASLGGGNGPASCLLDGNPATYYQSGTSAKYPHAVYFLFHDDENTGQAQELEFNYLILNQANVAGVGAPKSFTVQILPVSDWDPTNPEHWINIEDENRFYLTRDYDPASGDTSQYVYLSQSYKAYGIRLVFNASLPETEGGSDAADHMTLGELKAGLLK